MFASVGHGGAAGDRRRRVGSMECYRCHATAGSGEAPARSWRHDLAPRRLAIATHPQIVAGRGAQVKERMREEARPCL
jgi:hypothetical protein